MEELRKLREKLIQVQKKTNSQRLSERNMVEIVSKLTSKYSLELIYTTTGKEFLTPQHLQNEIQQEVRRQGRLSIIDLPSIFNVSISYITQFASVVAQRSPDIYLIDGQMMSSLYLDTLAEEINEALEEAGQMSLNTLTFKYSLPSNFLRDEIEKRLGTIIQGQFRDRRDVLYTDIYMERHYARLRGFLRGTSRPTNLKNFDASLYPQQVASLIKSKEISGVLKEGTFIPTIYSTNTQEEIKQFYQINRFIQYEQVKRIMSVSSTSEAKKIISTELPSDGVHLETCYIHNQLLETIRNEVSEALQGKDIIDVFESVELPMCIEMDDIEGLCEGKFYSISQYIFTEKYLDKALKLVQPLARKVVQDDRKSKTKRKGALTVPKEEVVAVLRKAKFVEELDEELYEPIADMMSSKVTQMLVEMSEESKEAKAPSGMDPSSLVEDVNYLQICCKSLGILGKKYTNLKPLEVHLIKTLAGPSFNKLLAIQVINQGFPNPGQITNNTREKFLKALPEYLRLIMNKLVEALSNKNPTEYLDTLLDNIKDIPVVSIRPLDKKTERTILHKLKLSHKQNFLNAISSSNYSDMVSEAAKYKLIDALNAELNIPQEGWGLDIIKEIYSFHFERDVLLDFIELAIRKLKGEEVEDEQLLGLSHEVSNIIK